MSYSATQQAARRASFARHVIEEVRYQQTVAAGRPISESPILCSCSAVVTSGTWDAHRGRTLDAARHAVTKAARGVEA